MRGHILYTKAPQVFHAGVLDLMLLVYDFAERDAGELPYQHSGSITGFGKMPPLPCGLLQGCPDSPGSPDEGPCPIHDPDWMCDEEDADPCDRCGQPSDDHDGDYCRGLDGSADAQEAVAHG